MFVGGVHSRHVNTELTTPARCLPLHRFARVIAIDQQGQGASDIHPDGFSVPMLKVLSIASDIMGQPTHTRHTTDRAAAYTRAVETLKARAALHQQQQQQQQPPQQSSPSQPAAAPAPSPGGDKGDKMKLGMEHMHALVAALEKSPYAPPLTGVPATTAAKDIALLLNATKAEAPVVIVTFKVRVPTAAHVSRACRSVTILRAGSCPVSHRATGQRQQSWRHGTPTLWQESS